MALPRSPFRKPAWILLALAPLLLLVAGCHRDTVKVYRVAKDEDQSQQPSRAGPAHRYAQSVPAARTPGHLVRARGAMPAASRPTLPQLTWKTPDGWTEASAGEMRVASFKVQGPDGKRPT